MAEQLRIPVLLGTARQGNSSELAARYIHKLLELRGVQSDFIDPADYREKLTLEKEHTEPWATIMKQADGLIIVMPEYNRGYPGPLKELLDSLYDEYARKPVAICGTSTGGFGGARGVEQLKPVLIELGMFPLRDSVYFSHIRELFNEDGSIRDSSFDERCQEMFEELFWTAYALKDARDGRID